MTSFLCEFLGQCKMLTSSNKLATMPTSTCQKKEKLMSLATTCPHAWQKHVLPANQNSKFWQLNFKLYLPTWERFGATPQTFEGKQVDEQRVWALYVWSFDNQNSTQLSTEKHWLTFCHSAGANCVISFMAFFNTSLNGTFKRESCLSSWQRFLQVLFC